MRILLRERRKGGKGSSFVAIGLNIVAQRHIYFARAIYDGVGYKVNRYTYV